MRERREDLLRAPLVHRGALVDELRDASERLPVTGQHELAAVGRGGRAQRLDVGDQRARPVGRRRERGGIGGADRRVRDRVRGDPLEQVVAGQQQPLAREHGVGRAVAGPLVHAPGAAARDQLAAVVEDPVHARARDEAPERAADPAERLHRPLGHAVAAHQRERVGVVGVHAQLDVATGTSASFAVPASSAPERRCSSPASPTWSSCWWVRTISSRSSTATPCSARPCSSRASVSSISGPASNSVSGEPRSSQALTSPIRNGVGSGIRWTSSGGICRRTLVTVLRVARR